MTFCNKTHDHIISYYEPCLLSKRELGRHSHLEDEDRGHTALNKQGRNDKDHRASLLRCQETIGKRVNHVFTSDVGSVDDVAVEA